MKISKIAVGIIVIIIFIVGASYIFTKEETTPNTDTDIIATTTPKVSTTTPPVTGGPTIVPIPVPEKSKSFTMAEIATHSSEKSCWTAIRGNVYDLTAWIGGHPGGEEAILGICGKDGTFAFEGKHGEQSGPNTALEKFIIGIVVVAK